MTMQKTKPCVTDPKENLLGGNVVKTKSRKNIGRHDPTGR